MKSTFQNSLACNDIMSNSVNSHTRSVLSCDNPVMCGLCLVLHVNPVRSMFLILCVGSSSKLWPPRTRSVELHDGEDGGIVMDVTKGSCMRTKQYFKSREAFLVMHVFTVVYFVTPR